MKNAVTLRLEVNGTIKLVNTYVDGNIVIDRRIQNFEQLQSQQGTLTKLSFRVPLEGELIEAIGDLTDLTQNPLVDIRKAIKGSIIIQGQDVYQGSFQILNIYTNQKEVELIFQADETALKSSTKDIKLSKLFEDETTPYTATDIRDALNLINAESVATYGWLYSFFLIDYGQNLTGLGGGGKAIDDVTTPLLQTDFKPQVPLGKIIELLKDNEGIEIEVDSSINDLLNQYIPLHNNNEKAPIVDTASANNTGTLIYSPANLVTLSNNQSNIETVLPNAFSFSNYNTVGFTNNNYTAQANGNHVLTSELVVQCDLINIGSAKVSTIIDYGIKVNGGAFQALIQRRRFTNTDGDIVINITNNLSLDSGDVVTFFTKINQGSVDPSYSVEYDIYGGIRVESTPAYSSSTNVLIGANFPEDMNVWDHCIKTILNQCNGIITQEEGVYKITPWADWVSLGTDFDLNDSVLSEQKVKIQPPSTVGAKSINFKYLEDDDFYNEVFRKQIGSNFGELIIEDTGIDFASNTVKVEIPYAPTPLATVTNFNIPIPKLINEDFETFKAKPRLLKVSTLENQYNVYITNSYDPTNISLAQPNGYLSNWENLNGGFNSKSYLWGTTLNFFTSNGFPNDTLYNRFWKQFILETYGIKSRKVSIEVVLTQWQAINLQLNERVIYKDAEYRILSLSGIDLTNPSSPITIEMALRKEIENIDIAPFYPFDVINTVVQWKNSLDNVPVGDASGETASEVEASAVAYGFFYDSVANRAIQQGQILIS